MKARSLLTLAGLAISFALPAFGQEKDAAVDPQIVQELHAIGKKSDEAFLKGDAASVATLYTEDAVLVNDIGPVYGRHAIEKYYADQFQEVRYFRHDTKYDPTSPHPIGTDGNVVWENGEWSGTFFLQGEDCGPHQVRGYFASINVREGNTWRVCMSTFSISPQRPTTTATNQ
jgi:ketosteroid isomerase-like protein